MSHALRETALKFLAPLLFFVVLALGWQWVALNLKSILPPLQSVVADIAARPGFYLANLWVTVQAALLGFAAGGGLAFLLAVASGYFPLGLFYYTAWHAFLLYHLADALARWSGHPFALGPAMQQAVHLLDTAAVVLLAPNALRTFCLHFVSSNMHYYGDIDSRNVVQQTQVWTSPWAAPLHLFCFNFGATHAIHHFVVRDPFYIRQAIAPSVYPLMRAHGVRFNDFGSLRRANRWSPVGGRALAQGGAR